MSNAIRKDMVSRTSTIYKTSLGMLFWSIVFATVACDFLGLCNLLPTHSQHVYRPYFLSAVQFKVFKTKP